MKKLLLILFFVLIPINQFGFYGDGSGRSFIDFLVGRYYLGARTNQIGFLYGTEHVRVDFGRIDLSAYFNSPTDRDLSIEPYIRVLYNTALETVENLGGVLNRYKDNNFNVNAYGFDYFIADKNLFFQRN